LFEKGTAAGKSALEITGENVAAFCDELLPDEKTYVDTWRETLNRNVAKKLGK
jgi:DNA-binding ferritin-like protein (Dps family)